MNQTTAKEQSQAQDRAPAKDRAPAQDRAPREPGRQPTILPDAELVRSGKPGPDETTTGTTAAPPAAAAALSARIMRKLRHAAQTVSDLIVPPVCLVCSDALGSHDALCGACWQRINFIRRPFCERTGNPLPFDAGGPMLSGDAIAHPPIYERARAVAQYSGVMQDLVHGFKYSDRHDARRLFGRWMFAAGQELLTDADLIIPVPLNRFRLLSRRFNQSALLAQEVAKLSGVRYEPMALLRPRRTETQIGKTIAQRRQNVSGAFAIAPAWGPRLKGKSVLLIDDVMTTGATINACVRSLKQAGTTRVDVLVLAKATGASNERS